MIALVDIHQQCSGRWSGVLTAIGLPRQAFTGKHGDCLVCGDDRKNARWNPKKEYWVCSKCGVTQAMELALKFTGESFRQTAARIRGERIETMEPIKREYDYEKNKTRLQAIHKTLSRLTEQSLAFAYFTERGISVLPEKNCHESTGVPYYQDGAKQGAFPALCSSFRNISGEICSYHVTYLSDDCKTKRAIESPKKILPSLFPLAGCSVQLFEPKAGVLGIAEGIETALAVHQLEGLPMWAAGNAVLMEALQVPESVNEVWIYADNDASFTGQKAAYTLANRLKREGKKVFVEIPKEVGTDFLDELNRERFETEARRQPT
jgi:putative DNA primase/helicase